jgi:hypothetical protein
MDAARAAGSSAATTANTTTKSAASDNTRGSKGLTANKSESSKWEAAALTINPIAQPARANLAADKKINHKIPDRCDPKAMRIAISCTRSAAEKAMTL